MYVVVMPRYKNFYMYHDYHDMLNLVNSLMYDLLFAPIAYFSDIQVIESID